MPTANLKLKRREAVERFPRTDARVECAQMRRPPADRMVRTGRRDAKAAFREMAMQSPNEVLERLCD